MNKIKFCIPCDWNMMEKLVKHTIFKAEERRLFYSIHEEMSPCTAFVEGCLFMEDCPLE